MMKKNPAKHAGQPSPSVSGASVITDQGDMGPHSSENFSADLKSWGTQSIHRAVAILRQVATYGYSGAKAVDLAGALELDRATVYRMLRGLVVEGMVVQDSSTKRYRLGQTMYELGLAASLQYDLKAVCQSSLQWLAEMSGDSVFLMVRSGLDLVCLDVVEGGYQVQARMMRVGNRLPLGVGAGSIAMLMHLTEAETEYVINANAGRYPYVGHVTPERVRNALKTSRTAGYAINEGDVLPNVSAIGVAIRPNAIKPYASISITTIDSRMESPRREEMAKLLLREVSQIEKRLEAQQLGA